MARARNIKPGLYKNEDLAECSIWARYLFPGLWMLADREGRLEDRPKRIKGELLPFDPQDVEPLLRELERGKFILRYESDGLRYIQIQKFKEHQSPHYTEKPSGIKPPPLPEINGHISGSNSGSDPGIKRGSLPPDSLIHRFTDSLIPDSKAKPLRALRSEVDAEAFGRFWAAYPKKKSKGDAEKAWAKIKPDEHLQDRIIDAIERAKTSADWRKESGQYIPYPATWLNDKGWEDEPLLDLGVHREPRRAVV